MTTLSQFLGGVDPGTIIRASANPDSTKYLALDTVGAAVSRATWTRLSTALPAGSVTRPLVTWTKRTFTTDGGFTNIASNGTGTFVGVTSTSGRAYYSTDGGVTWTYGNGASPLFTGAYDGYPCVDWDATGSQFIAWAGVNSSTGNVISTSADGITWTARHTNTSGASHSTIYATSNKAGKRIARAGSRIYIPYHTYAGGSAGATSYMVSTDAGVTWASNASFAAASGFHLILTDGTNAVAAGDYSSATHISYYSSIAATNSNLAQASQTYTNYGTQVFDGLWTGTAYLIVTDTGIWRQSTASAQWLNIVATGTSFTTGNFFVMFKIDSAIYCTTADNSASTIRVLVSIDDGMTWQYMPGRTPFITANNGAQVVRTLAYNASTRRAMIYADDLYTCDDTDQTVNILLPYVPPDTGGQSRSFIRAA